MRRHLIAGVLSIFAFQPAFSWAYDEISHGQISEETIKASQLNLVLVSSLGMDHGIDTKLVKTMAGTKKIETVLQWILFGSAAEDYGKESETDYFSTRGFNHYHDPLKEWDDAAFDHLTNDLYRESYCDVPKVVCPVKPVSALLWGLGYGMQDFEWNRQYPDLERTVPSDWSWGKARNYYYAALTSETEDERNQNLADCFRALGQVMHLLQDMSVPLHTRNDIHVFPNEHFDEWPRKFTYEAYVSKVYMGKHFKDISPVFPHPRILQVPFVIADPDYPDMVPVSGLFDRNAYNEPGPIPPSDILGLAEYSNANFLTLDTMWKYQHPSLDDTTYDSVDWLHPESLVAENGKTYKRLYIKFKNGVGEDIAHLAAVDYYTKEYLGNLTFVTKGGFTLDEACWKDYADKLIPRAVGYSAALLDYFFRGELSVKATPVYTYDAVRSLKVGVRNVTASQEAMSNGDITVTCTYYDSATGEERFAEAPAVQLNEPLPFEGLIQTEFTLSEPIPVIDFGSIKCMLAFRGTLGNEQGAVIGRYVPLTKLKEEWDDGLTGNHPWIHESSWEIEPGGIGSRAILDRGDGVLCMDNERSMGEGISGYNESHIELSDGTSENPGLLITPNTLVQLKIDDISINVPPPAMPGYTRAWQGLWLGFNNGLRIQFSVNGHFVDLCDPAIPQTCDKTAYRTVILGHNATFNIYQEFATWGVDIVAPLFLKFINHLQHLDSLEDPSIEQHHQHMEVDYIRIVEPAN